MYADVTAAWNALRSRYNVDPETIILYGMSMGTVASMHLATRQRAAAVVLVGALVSGMRVLRPRAKHTGCLDIFNRSLAVYVHR